MLLHGDELAGAVFLVYCVVESALDADGNALGADVALRDDDVDEVLVVDGVAVCNDGDLVGAGSLDGVDLDVLAVDVLGGNDLVVVSGDLAVDGLHRDADIVKDVRAGDVLDAGLEFVDRHDLALVGERDVGDGWCPW